MKTAKIIFLFGVGGLSSFGALCLLAEFTPVGGWILTCMGASLGLGTLASILLSIWRSWLRFEPKCAGIAGFVVTSSLSFPASLVTAAGFFFFMPIPATVAALGISIALRVLTGQWDALVTALLIMAGLATLFLSQAGQGIL